MEFRRAVAVAHEASGSSLEVAREFGCSESWVRRLMQRERETGSLAPRPIKLPDNNKLDDEDLATIARLIDERPDIQLGELAEALSKKVSVPTLSRATRKLGYSRKKRRSTPRSRIERTSSSLGQTGSSRSRM